MQSPAAYNLTGRNNRDSRWLNPATLIAVILLLAIFEGALRKWVFASNPTLGYLTYFAKDFLFFYAGYLGLRRTPLYDMSWIALCAALILVPSAGATLISSNPVGVFLSLRAYLLIPICAFLAASLIRGFRDIEHCALLIAVAAMGVALLGAYQYWLPPSHVLNRYAGGDAEVLHIVAEAGHVRATGTFAYISGMAMLAGLAAWAGAVLALPLSGRAPWKQFLGTGSLGASFVCSATAMTRGGLMFLIVIVIGSSLLYFRPRQVVSFTIAILLLSPFLISSGEQLGEGVDEETSTLMTGLNERLSREGVFVDRVTFVLQNFYFGVSRHPLGEGLGNGQPGSRYMSGDATKPYESEWGRIAFEIGPIGLATVLLMRLAVVRRLWQCLARARDDSTRLVMACSLPYFGIMSLGWMAFNHTGNTFSWCVASLSLAAAANYGCRAASKAGFAIANPYGSLEIRS